MRSGALLPLWLLAVAPPAASGPALAEPVASDQRPCEPWMQSVQAYDDACEAVLQGEPEADLRRLKEIVAARDADDPDGAERLAKEITVKRQALAAIDAPGDIADVHARLVAYYVALEKAGASLGTSSAGMHSRTVRACYEALLAFDKELYGLLAEHGCRSGDIDTLRDTIIPRLESTIGSGNWDTELR